jgi:hypothetical protein
MPRKLDDAVMHAMAWHDFVLITVYYLAKERLRNLGPKAFVCQIATVEAKVLQASRGAPTAQSVVLTSPGAVVPAAY